MSESAGGGRVHVAVTAIDWARGGGAGMYPRRRREVRVRHNLDRIIAQARGWALARGSVLAGPAVGAALVLVGAVGLLWEVTR